MQSFLFTEKEPVLFFINRVHLLISVRLLHSPAFNFTKDFF